MSHASTITPTIVNSLYEDALQLAEEARTVFEHNDIPRPLSEMESERSVMLSCEALRTTTRMMHVIAWLLNHRAFFAGEMTEFQLRRHGRLPPAQPESQPEQFAMLDYETRNIVARSKDFHERIARLDRAWRDHYAMQPAAVHRLQDRLDVAFG